MLLLHNIQSMEYSSITVLITATQILLHVQTAVNGYFISTLLVIAGIPQQ